MQFKLFFSKKEPSGSVVVQIYFMSKLIKLILNQLNGYVMLPLGCYD